MFIVYRIYAAIASCKNFDEFSRFYTIPERDRRTTDRNISTA